MKPPYDKRRGHAHAVTQRLDVPRPQRQLFEGTLETLLRLGSSAPDFDRFMASEPLTST